MIHTRFQQGQPVPHTRIGRAVGFASLGIGLAWGAVTEATSRVLGGGSSSGSGESSLSSILASDANAKRVAQSLCRMRGAALKLGQMLSIQDETLLPPSMMKALDVVRQGATAMPQSQLHEQLQSQLGNNWRDKFVTFDDKTPFAAASIGQVHKATIALLQPPENHNSTGTSTTTTTRRVAVKVQYPGVGNSIESDLRNVMMLVNATGMAPKGLFLDRIVDVSRKELLLEVDYEQELQNQLRMKQLVESDPILVNYGFIVPDVYPELSTKQILTTEFVSGGTIDKISSQRSDTTDNQEERNRIARAILTLTLKELFEWRFVQTDPNWGNFLYDVHTSRIALIDFGSTRQYDKKHFVDSYLRIVLANANRDREALLYYSHCLGFLTGHEHHDMIEAHVQSGYTMGDPFSSTANAAYDFKTSQFSKHLSKYGPVFMKHRLTPPPEEVYTLHRKLVGAFMLCIKLGAVIPCRDLLEQVVENYTFENENDDDEYDNDNNKTHNATTTTNNA